MEETVKENEQKEIKTNKSKLNLFFKVSIFVWIIVILICGTYLFNSFSMVNKYDVDKFKLGKFEITTLNGVLKKNRKLVYASDKNDVVTLKYDINDLTLNNVYEYLQELSSEGYTIVNLEDLYMRVVHLENDIQIRIKIGSNHLVFEHNIGIDYDEKTSSEKEEKESEKKDESNKTKSKDNQNI